MEKKVLILGSEFDPHVRLVQSNLSAKGTDSIIFDVYNRNHKLTLGLNDRELLGYLNVNNTQVYLKDISKVWWRIKPSPYLGDDINEKAVKDFISVEWRSVLNCLFQFMPNSAWINHPTHQHNTNYKLFQLLLARKVGFLIPETAISNDSEGIISCLTTSQRMIYKQIGWTMFPNGEIIFTNETNKKDLKENSEEISLAPGIYQNLLDKEYELRVTVVGESIFSVKINSQKNKRTLIDWRHEQQFAMYEPYVLDDKLTNMLFEFNLLAGLEYGAFDIVKTKDGNYVFLECNPSGQWLWIEEKLPTYRVTEALVDLLLEESTPTL